jgi:hypothetical protein
MLIRQFGGGKHKTYKIESIIPKALDKDAEAAKHIEQVQITKK